MLLALVSSAFALTIPVRVTHTEWISPGETPAAAATTATVKLSNPTTAQSFSLSAAELTPTKREASGGGEVSFDGDPAGTVRSWAVFFLDADGAALGEPELLDVVFDDKGNAALAGSTGARAAGLTVRGTSPVGEAWTGAIAVDVQDAGVEAAYVGVVELTSDGSRLATVPDLGVLDLATYATFQELGLDAIVALDTYRVRLDGEVGVNDAAVSAKGTIERGEDLRWDLTFSTVDDIGVRGYVVTTLGTESYLQDAGAVKKSGVAQRVELSWKDVTYDAWDAGMAFAIEGDLRGLELVASLDASDGDTLVASSDVILLDPANLEAEASIDLDADSTPDVSYRVDVRDSAGGLVSQHYCALAPTAATLADPEVDTWIGDCTRDDAGPQLTVKRLRSRKDTAVRHLNAQIRGSAREQVDTSCTRGSCTTETVGLFGGDLEFYGPDGAFLGTSKMAVTETEWNLAFAFDEDVDGLDAAFRVDIEAPAYPELTWAVDENGDATGTLGGETRFAIAASAITGGSTGLYGIRTGGAGDEPAYRLSTGPGAGTGTGTLGVQANTADYVPAFKKKRMIAGSNGGPSTF